MTDKQDIVERLNGVLAMPRKEFETTNGEAKTFSAINAAIAEIERLRGQGWQNISTAPKDGAMFLLCNPKMMNLIAMCKYNRVHRHFLVGRYGEGWSYHFMHEGQLWRPLPTPPKGEAS